MKHHIRFNGVNDTSKELEKKIEADFQKVEEKLNDARATLKDLIPDREEDALPKEEPPHKRWFDFGSRKS